MLLHILTELSSRIRSHNVVLFYREGGKNVDKFWDLLEKSVIVQGLIVVMVFGLIGYLLVTKQEVPEQLWWALSLVLGFFFGSKTQQLLRG